MDALKLSSKYFKKIVIVNEFLVGKGRSDVVDDDKGEKRKMKSSKSRNSNIIVRSSHQRCSIKKFVSRNFAKFTGKHLSILRNF